MSNKIATRPRCNDRENHGHRTTTGISRHEKQDKGTPCNPFLRPQVQSPLVPLELPCQHCCGSGSGGSEGPGGGSGRTSIEQVTSRTWDRHGARKL
ncbi:hypothetical protein Vadar_023274 [Vaccinium darrowii]|uniref:Uncharacterized protein n=1 Tax=Vaccinium darrowii TaxID=229202 RepID=A0ACB7ZMA8_9ERIC|nr:hypothetical protein Vadar_023274 [Vaccinium darrowii]